MSNIVNYSGYMLFIRANVSVQMSFIHTNVRKGWGDSGEFTTLNKIIRFWRESVIIKLNNVINSIVSEGVFAPNYDKGVETYVVLIVTSFVLEDLFSHKNSSGTCWSSKKWVRIKCHCCLWLPTSDLFSKM